MKRGSTTTIIIIISILIFIIAGFLWIFVDKEESINKNSGNLDGGNLIPESQTTQEEISTNIYREEEKGNKTARIYWPCPDSETILTIEGFDFTFKPTSGTTMGLVEGPLFSGMAGTYEIVQNLLGNFRLIASIGSNPEQNDLLKDIELRAIYDEGTLTGTIEGMLIDPPAKSTISYSNGEYNSVFYIYDNSIEEEVPTEISWQCK
jgi:hypothetical protein